jgi:hypothetical protein
MFIPNHFTLITNAKKILRWFELTLNLEVNFHRSSLVDINLHDEFTVEITNVIYFKWKTLLAQYLDLLFGGKPEKTLHLEAYDK